jgi:tetratricopeptide (TPR) repeat protein
MNEDKNAANELLANEKFQAVVDVLSPWVERKVGDPQVYSMCAKAQWKLKAYDEAVGNYERAMRLDYSDAYTHLELGQLLTEMGKTGRALTEFELAIQDAPRDPLTHYNFGLALYRMGRRDEALEQWEIAYSLSSKNPTYAEAMAIGLTGEDDQAALRYFERADSLGAESASFHNNFGLLLQRLGDLDRAEAEFRVAIAGEPNSVDYRRNLALAYMGSGQTGLAVPLWEELLRGDSESPVYRIYLGRAYLGLQRYDAAIETLKDWVDRAGAAAIGREPTNAHHGEGPPIDEAFDVLAMSYRGQANLGRAESYIGKALEAQPNNPAYLINYGVILAESGKITEAKQIWKKVLEIDPDNAVATQNLSVYER